MVRDPSISLTPPAESGYVRPGWIAKHLGVSLQTIRRWAQLGLLPPPLKPTSRLSLYPRQETLDAISAMRAPKGGVA